MDGPTLFLTVGLPGTGKTTAARRIEVEQGALRLTKDEWVKALYGHDNPAEATAVIEGRLIEVALRALEQGIDVVVDFGLWTRNERAALRWAAADVGAAAVVLSFDVAPTEQRKRLDQRLVDAPDSTWPISDAELAEWSAKFEPPTPGEVDGTEPIGDPPTGHTSWREWIEHRWPRTVS